jgi:oxygen-independent coproporphyrinogen-3 oxidase
MLKKEIELYAKEAYFEDRYIRSLWIGGGTPSAVPFERIQEVLNLLVDKFNFREDTEITLETNLFDLNEDYIKTVAKSQVTRLSIGVQSFNDKYLKMMGRTYRRQWIDEFFKFIKSYNLDISIDVMYRYPGQTVEEVREDMRSIVSMSDSIDHITLYSLILFPRLSIYKQVKSGKLPKQPNLKTYYEMNKALTDNQKGLYKVNSVYLCVDEDNYLKNHFYKFNDSH